jgi:hypothetical protein
MKPLVSGVNCFSQTNVYSRFLFSKNSYVHTSEVRSSQTKSARLQGIRKLYAPSSQLLQKIIHNNRPYEKNAN